MQIDLVDHNMFQSVRLLINFLNVVEVAMVGTLYWYLLLAEVLLLFVYAARFLVPKIEIFKNKQRRI